MGQALLIVCFGEKWRDKGLLIGFGRRESGRLIFKLERKLPDRHVPDIVSENLDQRRSEIFCFFSIKFKFWIFKNILKITLGAKMLLKRAKNLVGPR
jgi:hypothetical protein